MNKIILKDQTKTNLEYLIRYPEKSDVNNLLNYINTLSDERTFISYQGEHETIESETNFLNKVLKEINNKTRVHLLVIINNKIAGTAAIEMQTKTQRHIGVLAISVAKEFRSQGIGRKLLEKIIEEAISNIPQLEIITLAVYSKNTLAREMYKNFGFIEEGRLTNGVKLENSYDDQIFMYKNVK